MWSPPQWRRRTQRYLELFELAPDAYIVTDHLHRIVEANRAAAELLTHPGHMLPGKPLAAFIPLAGRAAFRTRLAELAAGADLAGWRLRVQPDGGSPTPVSVTVGPVLDGAGRRVGSRWILHDETASEQAQRALRESEARHRAVVETAVEGIITIDAQGTVQTMNPAAGHMFGYMPGEFIGRDVKVLVPAAWRDEHDGHPECFRGTEEPHATGIRREVRGRRRDGSTFPMELAVSEFRDGTGAMFAATIRDLTFHNEAQAAPRRYEEMISATGDLIAFLDRDYVYRAVNDAYAAAFGLARAQLIGRRAHEVLAGPPFEDEIKPRMDACLAGAEVRYAHWRELPGSGRGPSLRIERRRWTSARGDRRAFTARCR